MKKTLEQKKKKPDFLRQDAHKLKKLEKKWRRPKGRDSKMRRRLKSYRRLVKIGFGSPKELHSLNMKGLKEVRITNINELENIKENEIIVISGSMGTRKKIELLKKIKEKKLKVANLKDIDEFIKITEEGMKKKAETKKKKADERKKAKEETKKKAEKKKEEEPKEEKLEEEKKKTLEKPRSGKEGVYK